MTAPWTGNRLESLRLSLGMTAIDCCYLLGLSMNRWGKLIHVHRDSPLPNPSVSLLARRIEADPDSVPGLGRVDPAALFGRIQDLAPDYNLRRFALLLGCEAASGHRWVTRRGGISLPAERLLQHLDRALSTAPDPLRVLREFEVRAEAEACSRGIPDLWRQGHWRGSDAPCGEDAGVVTGATLRDLQHRLGIDAEDMRYLLGLSMNVWGRLVNRHQNELLPRPAVALLARLVSERPGLVELPLGSTPESVFALIRDLDPEYTAKRFGLLLGCDASAGYRWLKLGGNTSATVDRLLYFLERDLQCFGERTLRQYEARAEVEAASRGLSDIWRAVSWNRA